MGRRSRNISLPLEYDPLVTVVAERYGSFSAFVAQALDAVARHLSKQGNIPRGLDLELGILQASQDASRRRAELETARVHAAEARIEALQVELAEARAAAVPVRRLSVREIVTSYGGAPERQLRGLAVRHGHQVEEVLAACRASRAAQTSLHVLPADKGAGE